MIDRKAVYDKYGGKCAYCGRQIEYKDMQVDHIIPQIYGEAFKHITEEMPTFNGCRTTDTERKAMIAIRDTKDINCIDNLMPSCRTCNHYKRAEGLETFRKWIQTIPCKLAEREYIYKVGMAYGFFDGESRKVKFFFEEESGGTGE